MTSAVALPGLSQLIDWPTEHLIEAARAWKATADRWAEEFAGLWHDAMGVDWDGAAGQAMRGQVGDDKNRVINGPAETMSEAAKIARAGASDLTAASAKVRYAVEDAYAAGFAVGEDCSVTDLVPAGNVAEQVARQTQAEELAGDIRYRAAQLLSCDQHIGGRINTALAELHGFAFPQEPDGGAGALGGPFAIDSDADPGPVPEEPKQFHDWWESLSDEQKDQAYAADHNVGNHPGMPFDDKTHYNEQHLPELIEGSQAEVDRLQARYDQLARQQYMGDHSPQTASEITALRTQLLQSRHALDGYRNVQQAMQAPGGPKRYLGYLDDQGHAAISIGNPDTATRNAILVPGTGDDLTSMTDNAGRASTMYRAARAADTSLGDGDVAVTSWLGYDRPMSVVEQAPWPSYAHHGAGALDAFEDGMRASHIGAPSLDTVIGHSYGTTLVGAAAGGEHQLAADNVVAVASPGMLAGHAGDLNINPGGTVYAMTDRADPIRLSDPITDHTLGPDPMSPGFGAQRLFAGSGTGAGPGGILPNFDAHGSYWNPDTPALDNLGAIIAGVAPPHPIGK